MATEEWIKRAITGGKQYEDLPSRVRSLLSASEYKSRVKDHCINRGFSWTESLANTSCQEQEYYEDLLRHYRHTHRLFPYHLAPYICRMLRVTPFRYYSELLYNVMREEKSYDQIPNFAAADAVRLVGIGRNEYIAIMNKCKAKKLLWRVNRSIAKEFLPTEPLDPDMQPWWTVGLVNISETEHRAMTVEELRLCHDACKPQALRVGEVDPKLLRSLYKRGLIYLDVPILPDDHVSIPPLEGFVSNKDSERDEGRADPLESLLYAVFVANSSRASVVELAQMLSVDVAKLQHAISIACRLGFATRQPRPNEEEGAASSYTSDPMGLGLDTESDAGTLTPSRLSLAGAADFPATPSPHSGGAGLEAPQDARGQGVALVVDAEVTSYLMMGALSPGLKRHSVTLFEGGRVAGASIIAELIVELYASVEASAGFEGEMQHLASYAKALASALECVGQASGGRSIELLRKESLAGLAPAAACRVLSHAYLAVVPIAPLPYPPLPLSPSRPGPTNYGTTAEAGTPWLQLALYTAMQAGPLSIVLVCGQRIWRLPPHLATCTHALLWPWNLDAVRAQTSPILVDATYLLFTLNEYLARTAIMVQPLHLAPAKGSELPSLAAVDVPLPLAVHPAGTGGVEVGKGAEGGCVAAIDQQTGQAVAIPMQPCLATAVDTLGLRHAIGSVRFLQVHAGLSAGGEGDARQEWVPLQLQLGLPLMPAPLCEVVCRQACAAGFLSAEKRALHTEGQQQLQQELFRLISQHGACSNCLVTPGSQSEDQLSFVDLPVENLIFDGYTTQKLDYRDYQQGVGCLSVS